jgi:AAA domain-containing protein
MRDAPKKSETEADRIRQLYEILLAQHWTDRTGRIGPIDTNDILVTSPSSMQVKLLRTRLPKGAQVRMVERFEGQKAAVVLISMAISSSRHLSRPIELLHFYNRLNLAIWAARCVAIIVASPRLLETSCTNIGQLRLVNALSWAKNFADGHC